MLKGQDCVILIKLLAHLEKRDWSQRELSISLCISLSEVNASLKRLAKANLVRVGLKENQILPVTQAALEFLLHGVKYSFPVKAGEFTRGMPTGIAAPIFKDKLALGDDPLPVWPHGEGKAKGIALDPLYKSVPEALIQQPDESFYDLLALVDIIRQGRARERKIAESMLKDILSNIDLDI